MNNFAINMDALFSDGTENFRSPMEPKAGETVTIRIRTLRDNAEEVFLLDGCQARLMHREDQVGDFDYYTIDVKLSEEIFYYWFQIVAGDVCCYYDRYGASPIERWQYAFAILPGFSTPDWAKGAVIYQIFVDRFYNGDPANDVETGEYAYLGAPCEKVMDWNKPPAAVGFREFYGGDLQGVMDKLDYLQDLGVEVLYLNPIFVSPSNHKYDSQDYDYVDPHYGVIVSDSDEILKPGDTCNAHATKYIQRVTKRENLEASNQLFAKLVEEVHARGMKIILDGVFNHCGSFHKWIDRESIYKNQKEYEPGAYHSKESPYRSYFRFCDPDGWPENDSYDGWWGHDTLPKLNYEESPELCQYILDVAKKWVSAPYHADGWRLDVAADLGSHEAYNHAFWKKFRKAVKEANSNAVILAEHYGNPREWLLGDEWDTIMNYDAFMEPITWFLTGMEKHSDAFSPGLLGNAEAFQESMVVHMANMPEASLMTSMNELSNHDHSRFLTRTNHQVGRVDSLGSKAAEEDVDLAVFRQAVVMQMTWPGAPTIYYGDEAGVCGFTDPDNRRTYPWGRENQDLIQFHKDIIAIHKKYRVLVTGSLKFLYAAPNALSYGRFSREEQIIVVINHSEEGREMKIPVWRVGISGNCVLASLLSTQEDGYTTDLAAYMAEDGMLRLSLPAKGAMILRCGLAEESNRLEAF